MRTSCWILKIFLQLVNNLSSGMGLANVKYFVEITLMSSTQAVNKCRQHRPLFICPWPWKLLEAGGVLQREFQIRSTDPGGQSTMSQHYVWAHFHKTKFLVTLKILLFLLEFLPFFCVWFLAHFNQRELVQVNFHFYSFRVFHFWRVFCQCWVLLVFLRFQWRFWGFWESQ